MKSIKLLLASLLFMAPCAQAGLYDCVLSCFTRHQPVSQQDAVLLEPGKSIKIVGSTSDSWLELGGKGVFILASGTLLAITCITMQKRKIARLEKTIRELKETPKSTSTPRLIRDPNAAAVASAVTTPEAQEVMKPLKAAADAAIPKPAPSH